MTEPRRTWRVVFTTQARRDARKLGRSGLREKAEELLGVLRSDPRRRPPPYEKLVGDLSGAYSRRINIQHRLVYQILEQERTVKVLRMWTHYEWVLPQYAMAHA
ncbi:MAG TPA: Txe/YoeB family addiction module toxin [Thermoanaerobaculia bacterium]|nr:Txe/YoeB family addiction module toxin [Thermoanaerobaculia bacterium]